MAQIKVGEILVDISQRIDKCKEEVDEAIALHSNAMDEFFAQYKGQTSGNIETFKDSELAQLNKLSQMYEKTSEFVVYTFNQMKFTDEELGQIIDKGIQTGEGK